VIDANGRIDIGAWGTEVTMTRQVSAVLQNLVPIVDGGQAAPDATYNDTRLWGDTLGANTVVTRSGIGETGSGALVYVAGPALTAEATADSASPSSANKEYATTPSNSWPLNHSGLTSGGTGPPPIARAFTLGPPAPGRR
jgi:hypothetical protein